LTRAPFALITIIRLVVSSVQWTQTNWSAGKQQLCHNRCCGKIIK